MKYIVFKQGMTVHAVIFAEHTTHSQVKLEGAEVVSAGFFSIKEGLIVPYGKSDSLGVSSREEDSILIEAVLANAGIYAFLRP